MKVEVKGNVLTVVTGLTQKAFKAQAEDGVIEVRDEKDQPLYNVRFEKGSTAGANRNGVTLNAVIGGKLALVIVDDKADTEAAFREKYGKALLQMEHYTKFVGIQATGFERALNGLFAGENDTDAVAVPTDVTDAAGEATEDPETEAPAAE